MKDKSDCLPAQILLSTSTKEPNILTSGFGLIASGGGGEGAEKKTEYI